MVAHGTVCSGNIAEFDLVHDGAVLLDKCVDTEFTERQIADPVHLRLQAFDCFHAPALSAASARVR